MNIERPGSPSATIVAPASKRRSTSMEARRSRLASERPPKKGVATKNAFRSGELTAISQIYSPLLELDSPSGIQEDLARPPVRRECPFVDRARPANQDSSTRVARLILQKTTLAGAAVDSMPRLRA